MPNHFAEQLCLKCGLCCNGVIFADVQLQPGDDAARLKELGLQLKSSGIRRKETLTSRSNKQSLVTLAVTKFSQPCRALDGCRCQIYSERPKYCRKFECALLKNVNAEQVDVAAALRTIRKARESAERVRSLLRELGDTDETLALSRRFQRMAKRFHSPTFSVDETSADLFGQLTLAVHELNLLLSRNFYPGEISSE